MRGNLAGRKSALLLVVAVCSLSAAGCGRGSLFEDGQVDLILWAAHHPQQGAGIDQRLVGDEQESKQFLHAGSPRYAR